MNMPESLFPIFAGRDMRLFQVLFDARRARLPGGWCGYVCMGEIYPCFVGHEHFDDQKRWVDHYSGPHFSVSLRDVLWAEHELSELGLRSEYVRAMLPLVYLGWDRLQREADVMELRFALLHAPAHKRVAAALLLTPQIRSALMHRNRRSRRVLTTFVNVSRIADIFTRAHRCVTDGPACALQSKPRLIEFLNELTLEGAQIFLALVKHARGEYSDRESALTVTRERVRNRQSVAAELPGDPAELLQLISDVLRSLSPTSNQIDPSRRFFGGAPAP
jgi:hypothetical protein